MERRTALITGAAGFLGSFLTAALLNRGWQVYALVRGKPDRLVGTLITHELLDEPSALRRLTVLEGDVTRPLLGLSSSTIDTMLRKVTDVWHCATIFDIATSRRKALFDTNIVGTRHALDLAHALTAQPIRFHFISTAYCGLEIQDTCFERLSDRNDGDFRTAYEWSKSNAERIAIAAREKQHLDVRIYRPSIIAGHSLNGKSLGFNGYQGVFRALYILRRMLQNTFGYEFDRNLRLRISANPNLRLNLVPVDYVVDAMLYLADQKAPDAPIFNITHPSGNQLSELFDHGAKELGLNGIQLSGRHDFIRLPKSSLERLFERQIKFQAPYIMQSLSFSTTNFAETISDRLLHAPVLSTAYFDRMNQALLNRLEEEFENAATETEGLAS